VNDKARICIIADAGCLMSIRTATWISWLNVTLIRRQGHHAQRTGGQGQRLIIQRMAFPTMSSILVPGARRVGKGKGTGSGFI